MSLFRSVKDRRVLNRLVDEAFYAEAVEELSGGRIRDGLWAKAFALADGSEAVARAKYISLLAATLKDEKYLRQRAHEIAERERLAALPRAITPLPKYEPPSPRTYKRTKAPIDGIEIAQWICVIAVLLFLLVRCG